MRKYFVMSSGWPGPKRTFGELRREQRVGAASGAVEQKHCVIDATCGVAVGLAEGEVVELQFGEGFAAAEAEVLDDVRAVVSGPGDGAGGVGAAGADMVWAGEAIAPARRRSASRVGMDCKRIAITSFNSSLKMLYSVSP